MRKTLLLTALLIAPTVSALTTEQLIEMRNVRVAAHAQQQRVDVALARAICANDRTEECFRSATTTVNAYKKQVVNLHEMDKQYDELVSAQ